MKVRIKRIEHERIQDAPFTGALVCGIMCHNNCKHCFNKHMKKEPTIEIEAEEVIKEVKSNPFNEGIIFSGLEWSEQPQELVELCRLANENGLKIAIYTGLTISQFYSRIGKAVESETKLDGLEQIGVDNSLYTAIGSVVLDHAIPEEYYLKVGAYDESQTVDDYMPMGVKLATINQDFIKIVKGE